MGILLETLLTAGSSTQIDALILPTGEDVRAMIPEKMDIIMIIKKTAKVIPINKAENFPLSFIKSFRANLISPVILEMVRYALSLVMFYISILALGINVVIILHF